MIFDLRTNDDASSFIFMSRRLAYFWPKQRVVKTHYDNLLSKNEVTEREIFDYLFDECMTVGKRIKAQGANKGHTYSALMIQFACMLRARCSADTYDFFRKAFNMPPNQTLCKYSSSDSTSPQRSHGTNYYPNS